MHISDNNMIKVGLVDDHTLFREGLATLLGEFDDIRVVFSANNGKEMQEKLILGTVPDVMLMDINMQPMDGYLATSWLRQSYPIIHVLALSMYEDDISIIKMLRNGAGGYILKESNTNEVVKGIRTIASLGYYINDVISGRLIHSVRADVENAGSKALKVSSRELEFLHYCCTELTYKEIADKMNVSPRTVDNYREDLFAKLSLRSRTGLVIYAIKNELVKL